MARQRLNPVGYLSLKEAAERYNVSQTTIRRRIASGDLSALYCGRRIIRIPEAALDQLFKPLPTLRKRAS
ncbi:MAG: helix-turn-helix domain-containing protein [Actinobacteria bacterium]|nr:helix-turn-helix domain-containing protein [Actinomycetota bacterium]